MMAQSIKLKMLPSVINSYRRFAGHAHWQNVAKIKGANDAKKSKIMTIWIPRIRTEAKNDSNLDSNRSLKRLVDQAKAEGVPALAIKKAITCWENQDFKECQFGVKGKGGFIALIDCATSSKKKTENDIQSLMRRHGFSFASVNFQFTAVKDVLCQLPSNVSEDDIEEMALQCGTEDYVVDKDANTIEFTIDVVDQKEFYEEVKTLGLHEVSSTARFIPQEEANITESDHQKRICGFLNNMDKLEEVENVHHNVANLQEFIDKFS